MNVKVKTKSDPHRDVALGQIHGAIRPSQRLKSFKKTERMAKRNISFNMWKKYLLDLRMAGAKQYPLSAIS